MGEHKVFLNSVSRSRKLTEPAWKKVSEAQAGTGACEWHLRLDSLVGQNS